MRRAYTIPALVEELGKSESYIEGLIRDNKLPAKKEGRTTLVLGRVLDEYLESLPDA